MNAMSQTASLRAGERVDWSVVARGGAATALLGAAVVHSTVVAEHYAEWSLAGTFFVLLELVEVVLAIAVVLWWGRATQAAVAVTSLGTVAVWVVSRTVGMPFGPADFRHPESIGTADLSCCALELAATLLVAPWLLRLAGDGRRSGTAHRAWTSGPAVLLAAAAVAVTAWGLLPAVGRAPEHSGHSGHQVATTP